MPDKACQPCGLDRFAARNIPLFPAAGTRASGTASPMALAASSRLVLVTPSPMTLVTASGKATGLAAGRESCRVRPPVSEPLRPHRRSAGGGLCRSPRIGAPCLISCPRRSFRLYMSVFINYQYGNMSIAKASHPARTLIGRFRPLRGQLWTPVRMNRIPTSKYLIQYIYSRKSGQISARKGKFTLFAGFYRVLRAPGGAQAVHLWRRGAVPVTPPSARHRCRSRTRRRGRRPCGRRRAGAGSRTLRRCAYAGRASNRC